MDGGVHIVMATENQTKILNLFVVAVAVWTNL